MLMGFKAAAQSTQANMCKPHVAPASNAAFPLGLPGPDNGDAGFDPDRFRIPLCGFRLAKDIVAYLAELLRGRKIEPTVRLAADAAPDALNRDPCRANPHRNRTLNR